jgi:hypothetical protein
LFIFFHVEENEPKEDALSRLTLRVVVASGARGNSPRLQRGSNKSAHFDPATSPMLGAGQWNMKTGKSEALISPTAAMQP